MNHFIELKEPVNLGIGETNHLWLEKFKELHVFSEMRDAYRFAFAYAIAKNIYPNEILEKKLSWPKKLSFYRDQLFLTSAEKTW